MSEQENLVLDYDAFIRSIKKNKDISHSFLIGAGASISSGIQSAYDCIWEWKKDIFLSKNPNSPDFYKDHKNESVRSSIQSWLDNESSYPKLDSEEEYSFYAEKAYPIADDRRKYFQSLIEGREPYIGYKLLCLLNQKEVVKAVWTTNFDGLVVKAAHRSNLTPIEITLDSVDRIFRTESRNELLSIALHGDYKYSSLKNTSTELDNQDGTFVETISRYHNDKNLIVIGYSGRDKSLMDALGKTFSEKGSGRLYWCGYGHQINDDVRNLIELARKNGREAFFIPTDGFDKILLHLTKACFENDIDTQKQISEILKYSDEDKITNTPFSQDITRTDKYIKSNLHPISFPKEVFQFEMDYGEGRPWSTLRELTNDTDICAVPFKGKVFALGTLSSINKVFGTQLKGNVVRVPISKYDIGNVTTFKQLMLQALIKSLTNNETIESNKRNKLWLKNHTSVKDHKSQTIRLHRAVWLAFFFDSHKNHAFLSFKPALHLTSDTEISKETKQIISKSSLEKLRNDGYEKFLLFWNDIIFKGDRLNIEYPANSGTAFEFSLSSLPAFAEIMVVDNKFRAYHPREYNKRQTLHKGVQLLEPQLIFTHSTTNKPSRDFHPMRALTNHKPWDFEMNGKILPTQINIGIICGKDYASLLSNFLNKLHQSHKSNHNKAYLMDYPGFSNVYNLPISIPNFEDANLWLDVKVEDNQADTKETAIKLARLITSRIEKLETINGKLTVVIFIPSEWEPYRAYNADGESFDLHDYIKAFAASKGISTQLIEESTLSNELICQKAWWLSLSFYVKALRTPWVLNNTEENTAFAGIGYSINRANEETEIVIGCSHIYNSKGQGLKYKLSKVDDFVLDRQSNPFLSYDDAFQFGVSIRELFYLSMDKLPHRVVVHKRTRFTKDEVRGITESLRQAGIKEIDLIEINYESDARYLATKVFNGEMQIDGYAVSRGTCIVIDKTKALLWTHGIVPSVQNPKRNYYLGGRSIPAPLKITKHYGSSNINLIANEILGLTKMNWNSFDLYTKLPATINSSNQIARIGKLLSRFEGKTYDYRLFI